MTSDKETIRRKQPRYVPFDDGSNINHGDPLKLLGADSGDWVIDSRIHLIHPESVIGRLKTVGKQGEQIDLTTDTVSRAVRLVQIQDGYPTGKIVYALCNNTKFGMFFWSQTPVEIIEETLPEDIQLPNGPLAQALSTPGNKTLLIDMDEIIHQRGGDATYKLPKSGGRGLKDS